MRTLKSLRIYFAVSIVLSILLMVSCKKDKTEDMISVPMLATKKATNIQSSSAVSGGDISNNGGADISEIGICWSSENNNPTISDNISKNPSALESTYNAVMQDLRPSSTYYVRAYAINSKGTGYGDVISFSTGNAAPEATNVVIFGVAKINELLTGGYIYADAERNKEGQTIFQWYMANDLAGNDEVAIVGATEKTFRLQRAQQGKFIRFGVTPKAVEGTLTGLEMKSQYSVAVPRIETVTFKYNGADVTYEIIKSPVSGRKWLDRNLGAARPARAVHDQFAAGDLFQWGRPADGHQLLTRLDIYGSEISSVFGTTSTTAPYETSNTYVPATNKFILVGSGAPYDWLVPQNDELWQGASGLNNPCPDGWRIPTNEDFDDENLISADDAFNKLKLVYTGMRDQLDGSFSSFSIGLYWTSTVRFRGAWQASLHFSFIGNSVVLGNTTQRATGMACRCVKD